MITRNVALYVRMVNTNKTAIALMTVHMVTTLITVYAINATKVTALYVVRKANTAKNVTTITTY